MTLIELCVEGPDGAAAAAEGGADRVELCASLVEGGLTPSPGMVRAALAAVSIPIMAMVRPRGGDFLYSERDYASMRDDVIALRDSGVAGVVFGCLTADGDIDEARTTELAGLAHPMSVTVHRAFDMARDPAAALEALIRCGVDRVLTSGQRPTITAGRDLLRQLHAQAAGRIAIMGCVVDLTPDSLAAARASGLPELHFAAPRTQASPMRWRNPAVGMGGADDLGREYHITVTDPHLVRATIAAVR
jgi:copper homeostasis protein